MWKFAIIFFSLFGVVSANLIGAEVNVLAFAGSTREGSLNRKLVAEAAQMASQMGAKVTVIDLKDYEMPFYDGDMESSQGIPPKAMQLRRLMTQSQVIMIASPEYNGSLSGVLKNAIDWASREGTDGKPSEAFKGKTFLIMSSSPGRGGGAKGLEHLRFILSRIGGIVAEKQVTVPDGFNAFDAEGHLKSPAIKQELQNLVQSALR